MAASTDEGRYLAQIENLVFEGGGIKGLAFLGAMQVLEEHDVLKQCKKFAGSSAGAITAGLLACGFSCSEVADSMLKKNWRDFVPESRVSQITDLVRNWGLHGGDPFTKWFGDLVNSKLGKPDITFQELFDKTGHELVVTASCVNRRMLRFFHRCCHPNMPIVQAVRMSMSIPLFFTPVKYEDAFYCDGGLLNNFPLWVFDCVEVPDWARPCLNDPPNPKTLGFKLLSDAELRERKEHMYPLLPVTTFSGYLYAIVDAMLEQMDRLEMKPGDAARIIVIPTHDVSSTDFALSADMRQVLITSGRKAMEKFIRKGPPKLPKDECVSAGVQDVRLPPQQDSATGTTLTDAGAAEVKLVRARVAEVAHEVREMFAHLFRRRESDRGRDSAADEPTDSGVPPLEQSWVEIDAATVAAAMGALASGALDSVTGHEPAAAAAAGADAAADEKNAPVAAASPAAGTDDVANALAAAAAGAAASAAVTGSVDGATKRGYCVIM